MNSHLFPSSLLHSTISSFFIFISITTSHCYDDERFTNCNRPYNCVAIQNISYPFWGDARPAYCGNPGFKLNCVDGGNHEYYSTISIVSQEQEFRVLEVNQSGYTMRLARMDFWSSTCPEEYRNTSLNFTLFDYATTDKNISLFYGCAILAGGNNFTCSQNVGESRTRGAFFMEEPLLEWTSIPNAETCETRVNVPVLETALEAHGDGHEGAAGRLQKILNQGFDVVYKVNITLCDACVSSGGSCGTDNSTQSFSCLCRDQPHPRVCPTENYPPGPAPAPAPGMLGFPTGIPRDVHFKLPIGLIIGGGIAIFFFSIGICCFRRLVSSNSLMVLWRGKTKSDKHVEDIIRHCGSLAPERYSYSDIKKITNSLKDKLGQGGFGNVYKGKLLDGRPVAVKVLKESKGNGEEFINEVASISRTSHVNVVTLLGFCLEGHKRALVYEFMPNGSLEKFIYNENALKINNRHLGWEKLHQIAVGIAQGLEYLHRGCNARILHFDIKPHNILLDEDFSPKISDFGLAKLCPRKESIVSMLGARGTIGYIAPEVFSRNFGVVSHKSDVYSYGMMVLEMVGGGKNSNAGEGNTSDTYFPHLIFKRLELDNDLRLQGDLSKEENIIARKMILVGLWCIQTDPSQRPSMREVVEMLHGSVEALQIPPKPFLYSPPRSPEKSSTSSTISLL